MGAVSIAPTKPLEKTFGMVETYFICRGSLKVSHKYLLEKGVGKMDVDKNVDLNMYRVTSGRLQRIKKDEDVFAVWRGKTAFKDDVVKCYPIKYNDRIQQMELKDLKPLWIDYKNLNLVRSLSNAEIKMLDDNHLIRQSMENIFVYGKFLKQTEKAILVKFANEIDIWIAKSQIHNKNIFDLKNRDDVGLELPKWIVKEKLGQEVTDKFANAQEVISKHLVTPSAKKQVIEFGGADA